MAKVAKKTTKKVTKKVVKKVTKKTTKKATKKAVKKTKREANMAKQMNLITTQSIEVRKTVKAYLVIVESSDDGPVPISFATKKDRDGFLDLLDENEQVYSFTMDKVLIDVSESCECVGQ